MCEDGEKHANYGRNGIRETSSDHFQFDILGKISLLSITQAQRQCNSHHIQSISCVGIVFISCNKHMPVAFANLFYNTPVLYDVPEILNAELGLGLGFSPLLLLC